MTATTTEAQPSAPAVSEAAWASRRRSRRSTALTFISDELPTLLGLEGSATALVCEAFGTLLADGDVFDSLGSRDARRVAGALVFDTILRPQPTVMDAAHAALRRAIGAKARTDGIAWDNSRQVFLAYATAADVIIDVL